MTGDVGHDCYLEYISEWAFALRLRGQACATGRDCVEIIAEGPQSGLRRLVRRLRIERYPVRVCAIRTRHSPATGAFPCFSVSRDGVSTDCDAFIQKMKFWFAPGDIFPPKVVGTTKPL